MKTAATATVLGAFAATVAAHGAVTSFTVDGTEHRGYHISDYYAIQQGQPAPETAGWYAENLDNGFVSPSAYGTSDIACHKKAKPAKSSIKVAAGGKFTWNWDTWPESHVGPVITYVAKCDGDCSSADPASLKFVKIDAAGYNAETKKWAAQDLIANGNKWTTTIPAGLAPGNYVARHEIIALHGGGDANGAQNYPQCANIEITGSGTDTPEGTLATALYKADDAGIRFSPYGDNSGYKIPGPALYGAGSGSPTTPAPSKPSTPAPSEPATPAPTKPATPAPTEPSTPSPAPGNEDDECEADDEDDNEEGDDQEDDECDAEDDQSEGKDEDQDDDDECDAEEGDDEDDNDDEECDIEEPATEAPRARAHARDFSA